MADKDNLNKALERYNNGETGIYTPPNPEENTAMRYIWAVLIPIIGIIEGAILLASDKKSQRDSGSVCIVTSLMSIGVYYLIIFKR